MERASRYLYPSDEKWRMLLLALNSLRSKLIVQGG